MTLRSIAALVAFAAIVAGCGLKGPLYLPEKSKEVVVRPGPGASAQPATAPEAPPPNAAGESGDTPAPEPQPPADGETPPPGSSNG